MISFLYTCFRGKFREKTRTGKSWGKRYGKKLGEGLGLRVFGVNFEEKHVREGTQLRVFEVNFGVKHVLVKGREKYGKKQVPKKIRDFIKSML